MPRILMVASEATPFIKTGGLADVMEALPRALVEQGAEVAVVMPRYGKMSATAPQRLRDDFPIWVGNHRFPAALDRAILHGVSYYFVNCPELYARDQIYGDYGDNHIRFAALARAALEIVRGVFRPDVIHCHDWHTGLLPAYLHGPFRLDPTFLPIKTVFTIHNLGYHLSFPREELPALGLPDQIYTDGSLEFYKKPNFMKAALILSDALTTVSPRYATEIQTAEHGFGFEGVLRERASALSGILNGVDYSIWSPEIDPHLPATYNAEDLSGKEICKQALLAEMGLPKAPLSAPLIGIISRLSAQKGFDLLEEIAPDLMEETPDLRLVVLGSGEKKFEDLFSALATQYPDRCGVRIGFDDGLAHRIEAGADMFLMPSGYEPCGLNQMYSLRYGTVPVVRAVGGLDDTIDAETGFKFEEYTGEALYEGLSRALEAFENKELWSRLVQNGMARDHSWNASASRYLELYNQLTA